VDGQDVLLCSFFFFPSLFFTCPLPHISNLPIGIPGVFVLALVSLYPRLILKSESCRINKVRFAGKMFKTTWFSQM
jgi:hypothetical protein